MAAGKLHVRLSGFAATSLRVVGVVEPEINAATTDMTKSGQLLTGL